MFLRKNFFMEKYKNAASYRWRDLADSTERTGGFLLPHYNDFAKGDDFDPKASFFSAIRQEKNGANLMRP